MFKYIEVHEFTHDKSCVYVVKKYVEKSGKVFKWINDKVVKCDLEWHFIHLSTSPI